MSTEENKAEDSTTTAMAMRMKGVLLVNADSVEELGNTKMRDEGSVKNSHKLGIVFQAKLGVD
jgi:hypothetical protein